ncbi:MAG TPA: DUF1428 domain-containing protein [Burkholderiaceae bacterium]|nr:DUF1428 domain-containing protein [Burkholderiaceae bacterium]
MAYVDGFVVPVPADRRDAYLALAVRAAEVFRAHGALEVVECWGDDVPAGTTTDFHRAVKAEPGETVVFSWIVWPSREARDAGQRAAMADPRMPSDSTELPFDGRRMIWGGFAVAMRDGAAPPAGEARP